MLEKTQKLCIIKYTNKMLNVIKALNKKQNGGRVMDTIEKGLRERLNELLMIEASAKKFLMTAPEGKIYTKISHGKCQYARRIDEGNQRQIEYIRKKNKEIIQPLVQKEYVSKVLDAADYQIKIINHMLKKYDSNEIVNIYKNMHSENKKLILPFEYPEDEYAEIWTKEKEKLKESLRSKIIDNYSFYEENGVCTEKGEYVRSKSEKILADKFFIKNIPYVYEVPLKLKGYGYVKPDFVVLNKRTRQEYIWEHLGILDNNEYLNKSIKKIQTYEKNGYFVGKNLIITRETSENPLNIKEVEQIIEEYLM